MTPTDEPREVGKPNTKQQQANRKLVEITQDADAATIDYYSPGRKKEEMIANCSSPLKNLLVEANRKTKPISSILKENSNDIAPTTTSKVEEKKKKNNNNTGAEAKATTISEEWNSPARYPTEIKRDKNVKGRPYWAQFVCCSSGIN